MVVSTALAETMGTRTHVSIEGIGLLALEWRARTMRPGDVPGLLVALTVRRRCMTSRVQCDRRSGYVNANLRPWSGIFPRGPAVPTGHVQGRGVRRRPRQPCLMLF